MTGKAVNVGKFTASVISIAQNQSIAYATTATNMLVRFNPMERIIR
jgi:hypothetical protein